MEETGRLFKEIEDDMFGLSDQVKPTLAGRWLDPGLADQVSRLLRIGALALRTIRLHLQERQLQHLIATLGEEHHGRSD